MKNDSPHSKAYTLPFPTLQLTLEVPDLTSSVVYTSIVDTGADMTMVPISILKQLAAPPIDEVRLRSHWGESTSFITYLVDVRLTTGVLPGVEVVGDPHGDEILLGRNILNTLMLFVDGPKQTTSILTKRPTR
jgi:predicted aspartyl protease